MYLHQVYELAKPYVPEIYEVIRRINKTSTSANNKLIDVKCDVKCATKTTIKINNDTKIVTNIENNITTIKVDNKNDKDEDYCDMGFLTKKIYEGNSVATIINCIKNYGNYDKLFVVSQRINELKLVE